MSKLSAIFGITHTIFSNLFVTLPVPKATTEIAQQTLIVTGSNQGLGYESCRHLLRLGAGKVVMGVRNLEKGEEARQQLIQDTKCDQKSVEVWHIDMESYDSVKAFAAKANSLPRLDAVLANAGIMTETFGVAEDNERTLTVNVVSTFLLLLLLLPKLREAPSLSHFVIPNSALHYVASLKEMVPDSHGKPIFDRMNDHTTADMKVRYNNSKLLVILAVRELESRLKADGTGGHGQRPVIINTPNPSYCKSALIRDIKGPAPPDFLARTAEEGSRTLVHGLLAGPETSGKYLTNCHVQTPASFVENKTGARIQADFWTELIDKLDAVVPGVSRNI